MKNNTKYYFLLVVLIIAFFNIQAQTPDTTRVLIENNWIEKMNNKIAVDVSINNSYNTFQLENGTEKYNIYPNVPANIKFKVNYDFISLGIQFKTIGEEKELKGNSKSFEIKTALIFKHWFTDVSYNKVKGYYLENTDEYVANWEEGNPYIQFPNLHYQRISASAGYSLNPKFSFRSLTSQTERQLKSAGSFIPVVNFDYYIIDDKSSEINNEKSKSIEVSIGPGYAHTFVVKEKFYLSLGLSTSIGSRNTKSTTHLPEGNIENNQNNSIFRVNTKISIGYNGRKFYSGVYSNNYNEENKDASNINTRVFFQIFFGMRLDSPGYLKRFIAKVKSKI